MHLLLNIVYVLEFLPLTVYCSHQAECSLSGFATRLDCHPEEWANMDRCTARGCCWSEAPEGYPPNLPSCYFPKNYPTYTMTKSTLTERGIIYDIEKVDKLYSTDEVRQLQIEIRGETSTRLRIRVTNSGDAERWEPRIPLGPMDPLPLDKQYNVEIEKENFGLMIKRGTELLLDSTGGMASSFIVSDQFMQIAFRMNTQKGFGPGETRSLFPHSMDSWSRIGIWARDSVPMDGANLYGAHNFFMGLNHLGKAFGIFLLNSNAQEVALTTLPAITFRTIGGILDIFVFTGPRPSDVIAQYYALIGRPPLPPYWALGFHLSRYGYKDLNDAKETLQRNLKADIPIDAQWFDIDYMDAFKVWTVDSTKFGGLGHYINNTLHTQYGIKSIIILDPAISTKGGNDYVPFTSGLKMGIFINSSRTGKPLLGTVWPGETVFPDFAHPNAENWWGMSAQSFYNNVPFDGLWVDMNEPANFNDGSTSGCPENSLNKPAFVPNILGRSLFSRTVCPSAKHYDTTHYNRHNLYAYEQGRVTYNVLKRLFPDKRPFVLSRSTFAGSGRYVIHWTGDNLASWKDMRASIAQIINFNMFGIPMVGADICGFRGNSYEELCVRWSQLGAFYPFSRNHNEISAISQDPAVWSKQALSAIREAIKLRYHLLPYLYSLFYRSHLNGTTVARALAFEFPEDLNAHSVDTQFMLGSCLLVTPVLEEARTGVEGYVPEGEWINLSTGTRIVSKGAFMYFGAPLNVIPILVRAGCILTTQASAETTAVGRKKGLGLFVFLSSIDDGYNDSEVTMTTANGELFWDDGESEKVDYFYIEMWVKGRKLSIHSTSYSDTGETTIDQREMTLKYILINGISQLPTSVMMNGQAQEFTYENKLNVLRIPCPKNVLISMNIDVEWSF